jgi:hypothetical protein
MNILERSLRIGVGFYTSIIKRPHESKRFQCDVCEGHTAQSVVQRYNIDALNFDVNGSYRLL